MKEYPKEYLELLNMQIGCVIKINRLKKDISQHDLSVILETNPTAIGRIERAEVISGWDKIFILSQELNIAFSDLFELFPEKKLLLIVDEIYGFEKKMNEEKKAYYQKLKADIKTKYAKLK